LPIFSEDGESYLLEGKLDFVATFVFCLLLATLYLGPSIVAVCRHHFRTPQIIAVNILLGWTIVGLFWAFAWALSSTRPTSNDDTDALPSDFAERLFQNRNIVRQPDGGAIVYPGLLADEAYWLGAADFRTYLEMRSQESYRNFPRALVILISAGGLFLSFREWMGLEHGMAPAVLLFIAITLFVTAWDLVFRPRRKFLAAFPKAPRTHDPIRQRRKTLAGLVAFDPLVCFGATLLCFGLIVSLTVSLLVGTQQPQLRAQDGAMLILGFAILSVGGTFYGHLAWQHLRFFMRHRRSPTQFDLDALGTGVKAPGLAATMGTPAPSEPRPPVNGGRSSRGLAAALRSGARSR
jgi:Superinfection immunity protein